MPVDAARGQGWRWLIDGLEQKAHRPVQIDGELTGPVPGEEMRVAVTKLCHVLLGSEFLDARSQSLGAHVAQLLALMFDGLAEALDRLADLSELHPRPSHLIFLHRIGKGNLSHEPIQHGHHAVHLLQELLP